MDHQCATVLHSLGWKLVQWGFLLLLVRDFFSYRWASCIPLAIVVLVYTLKFSSSQCYLDLFCREDRLWNEMHSIVLASILVLLHLIAVPLVSYRLWPKDGGLSIK